MSSGGSKAREAALRSVERSGAEQLGALSGLCAFFGGFIGTAVVIPAALLSFWVCSALIASAIGIGVAVHALVARP